MPITLLGRDYLEQLNTGPQNAGGIVVRSWHKIDSVPEILTSYPYLYRVISLKPGHEYAVGPGPVTLHAPPESEGARTNSAGVFHELRPGGVLHCHGAGILISATGPTQILLAGFPNPNLTLPSAQLTPAEQIKRVTKPWGEEIWLSGEHPDYAFKRIQIKAGTKTSLQFHEFKTETNLLWQGRVRLYFKRDPVIDNRQVVTADLDWIDLDPLSSIQVPPGTLHRLEALTDAVLYEASSPELNDVIRVLDDTGRPDGRIAHEHLVRT